MLKVLRNGANNNNNNKASGRWYLSLTFRRSHHYPADVLFLDVPASGHQTFDHVHTSSSLAPLHPSSASSYLAQFFLFLHRPTIESGHHSAGQQSETTNEQKRSRSRPGITEDEE
jgi:hypothetical protein